MRRFVRKPSRPTIRGWALLACFAFAGGVPVAVADPGAGWSKVRVEASLPFDLARDALCFANGDSDLERVGVPLLGAYGAEKGVCQGIAGIAAAFREHVEFLPNASKDSAETVTARLREAVEAHQSRSGAKIRIRGYASLRSLCEAHRKAFLRKAIWLNAGIALDEILAVYGPFRRLKKALLSEKSDAPALRRQLGETLATALSELRAGRYPLLLYYSHVVLVRGYRELEAADGALRVELDVYDSNQTRFRTIVFPLARDGIPAGENAMHWVVSPR